MGEPDVIAVARLVCTAAELEAVERWEAGMSQWAIAYELGISRSAVRERLRNAERKIEIAIRGTMA